MSQYYDNIEDCKLFPFRDVMIKGDYRGLLIKGEFDQEEAEKNYYKIYDEYDEALDSNAVNMIFELTKQIRFLANEYSYLNSQLFMIVEGHKIFLITGETPIDIDIYIENINIHGYRFNKEKGIAYECNRIKNQLKNYETKINVLLSKIKKNKEESGKWNFDWTIESVQIHRRIPFDKETTVNQFVVALNMLIKSNKEKKDGK